MRKLLSWYADFLICCALLGLLTGMASAATGLDFAIGHSYIRSVPVIGAALPASNTILMTVAAALMASWAMMRGLAPFKKV